MRIATRKARKCCDPHHDSIACTRNGGHINAERVETSTHDEGNARRAEVAVAPDRSSATTRFTSLLTRGRAPVRH
eukprot:11846986-Alexandrium_andersonii.AAC.1